MLSVASVLLGLPLVGQTETLMVASAADASNPTYNPPPPPVVGEPGGRGQGGGYRGPECEPYAAITPLVPTAQGPAVPFQWGQTTRSHPTVWLAAPAGLAEGVTLELTLWADGTNQIYRTLLSSRDRPTGSFSVTFPPDAPALVDGEVYYWMLSIFCDPDVPDLPVRVGAYIQRTDLPVPAPAADPLNQSATYAAAGIWYDALAVLGANDSHAAETAVALTWLDLLQQVNLDTLPHQPTGSCCQEIP